LLRRETAPAIAAIFFAATANARRNEAHGLIHGTLRHRVEWLWRKGRIVEVEASAWCISPVR
jgi:hypothetical protein